MSEEKMNKLICPVCGRARMIACGKIRPGGRGKLRTVYRCSKCGYREIGYLR